MVWMGVSIPRSQISLRCCQAFPTTQPRCSLESCANGKKTMHSQNSSVVQCINFCAASMCLSISFFPCTRLLLLIVRTKFSDFNLTIRVIIAKISTRNEEILLNTLLIQAKRGAFRTAILSAIKSNLKVSDLLRLTPLFQ